MAAMISVEKSGTAMSLAMYRSVDDSMEIFGACRFLTIISPQMQRIEKGDDPLCEGSSLCKYGSNFFQGCRLFTRDFRLMNRLSHFLFVTAGGVLIPASLYASAILGPVAPLCANGAVPSILVKVTGLKSRSGKVRVRTFGGSPDTYFDKTKALKRLELPVPASGPIDICMPVSGPGVYAVDVRHDANNNGKTDRADGAGASGNPQVSLIDIIFKRKPPARQVQVIVGNGTAVVPVQVKYF
jgi:uncharacterized protein (DUF2141 family)